MTCPLCKAVGADLREDPHVYHLHCTACGDVTFSDVAYPELGSLTDDDRSLLAEYCRRYSGNPGFPMITHVRLHETIEEMRATRSAELLKSELNKRHKT
jgi:hypothetical protein